MFEPPESARTQTAAVPSPMGMDDASRRLLALIAELLAQTRPHQPLPGVGLDRRLDEDLGIDSLARVELGARIERAFGVRLREGASMSADTPRDLVEAILGAGAVASAAPVSAPAVTAIEGTPDDARTLLDALAWHVARHPDRRHVTFLASETETRTLSYRELDARSRSVAAGLRRAGALPGAACALMLPTSLEFFAAFVGVLMAGGIPVPIYPPFRPSQLEDHLRRQAGILGNCEAVLMITVPEARLLGPLLRGMVPTLRDVVTVGEIEASGGSPDAGGDFPAHLAPGDIAMLQYTSGSTGSPKGVVVTHEALLANMRAMGEAASATSTDVFVSWLPLYHDMGLIGAWMSPLYFGLPLVLMSPQSFLARPASWLWAIHRHRATISAAPNFAYELAASRIDDADVEGLDLSSLRWLFNGAEAVSAATMDRFQRRYERHGLDPRALAAVYGLAECTLDLAFPRAAAGLRFDVVDRDALRFAGRAVPIAVDDPRAERIVACGSVLPGYELRIVDARGRALAERMQGRIEFRGPSATTGYYRNPDATARLFDGEWLDSGDLGYLAEGELHVTGRAKDLIIRGGHNIHPYELEEAVGALPGVRKGCVAVLGVHDASAATERVVVIAETRERDEARRVELRAQINRLAVELIGGPADEIVLAPRHAVLKTSSGKIRRAATREAFERGRIGAPASAVWVQVARLSARSAVVRARALLATSARWAYGVWAWGVGLSAALAGVFVAFLVPGRRRRRRAARALARTGLRLAGLRLDASGLDGLPSAPYVAASNHASYLDAILLAAALPAEVVFVAKGEFRERWWMRALLGSIGTRYVERWDVARGVGDVRELIDAVRAGEALVVFPEGTFVRAPGFLPFHMGAFVVAAQTGVPTVPIGLRGSRAILPAGTWLPRRGRVSVAAGAALRPAGSGWESAVALRDAVRAEVARLAGGA